MASTVCELSTLPSCEEEADDHIPDRQVDFPVRSSPSPLVPRY